MATHAGLPGSHAATNMAAGLPPMLPHSQDCQAQMNETDMPKGQCRYILLLPEIKGQRCACVNFTLNRSMPSATCDCGHLACFHVKADEAKEDKQEMELLRQRVAVLERQLDRESNGGLGSVVARMSGMEEQLDKVKDDTQQEITSLYRNMSQLWQTYEQLDKRTAAAATMLRAQEEMIERAHAHIGDLVDRQLELADGDEALGERLEAIERVMQGGSSRLQGRPRRKSTSDWLPPRPLMEGNTSWRRSSTTRVDLESSLLAEAARPVSLPFRRPASTEGGPWTVHISFLPDASQPFPFEKDTTAYKRCLSRGLHQMVVVDNPSADAFMTAVSNAFGRLLKGRTWMPLEAKLCDAKQLQGLPMLRPLDPRLRDARYDAEFLREHCAVCDAGGKMESLYIAMRADTLSWHFIRHSPVYLDGLESCWEYDHVLDLDIPLEDDFRDDWNRPSAADVTGLPLKRAASEMSRAPSFGSAGVVGDGESSRKIQRTACLSSVVDVPRRTEKV